MANAAAGLAIALLAPLLGAMADRGGHRKRMLLAFSLLGICTTFALYLRWRRGNGLAAALLFALGTLGFNGGVVFYDALLLDVAQPADYDRVSALGYALGYLGGGVLFAINVLMVVEAGAVRACRCRRGRALVVRHGGRLVAGVHAAALWWYVNESAPQGVRGWRESLGAGWRELRRSIGTSTTVQQESANNFFTTVPPASTTRKIRIAAFGDCGREGGNATNQTNSYNGYQAFLTSNSIDAADAWLLLGDNAYNVGNSTEYTNSFFTPYGGNTRQILRNHKLYPSPGNHDYNNAGIGGTADRRLRTWHYFSCFTTPQNAECGGIASTKPNYYSFDIGNIHFLSLDSWGLEQTDSDSWMGSVSPTTVMKNWIASDLLANTKKWVIAYWHHPPYTKGSHNSDSETELGQIRASINVFLETKGVDLIISGHSHAYERSYLLRNFTGAWNSFVAGTHAANSSSAKWNGAVNSGPYKYNSSDVANPVSPLNHGTVYVVAGNTGAFNSSTTNFNAFAMPNATTNAGTFFIEVEDNRLDGRMINHTTGTTFEKFTIIKDGGNRSTVYNITLGQSQVLNASCAQCQWYLCVDRYRRQRNKQVCFCYTCYHRHFYLYSR